MGSNGRMGRQRADDALQAKMRYKLFTIDELKEFFTIFEHADHIWHCGQRVNLQAGNGEMVLIQCANPLCHLTFINVLSPNVNGGMVFKDTIVYEATKVWARTNPELLKEGVDDHVPPVS